MFGRKAQTSLATVTNDVRSVPKVPSIISTDMTVRGDLIGAGDVQIEGNVVGRIDCDYLVIAANGSVDGEVVAKAVRVSGTLYGSLSAETVTLGAACTVHGEIEYENLVIEAGARLDGQCRRLAKGTKDEKLMSDPTETAVESTLSHLSNVPRRVA